MAPVSAVLNFLHILEDLKKEYRTGWHVCGIDKAFTESISDHMYRMAMMALTVQDSSIDKLRAVKMALVHDMGEAITGDITPDCPNIDQKEVLEEAAMVRIRETLGTNPFGQELYDLWKEYTENSTPVAQFVKDLDKTELIIQVVEYEKVHKIDFSEWIDNAYPKIRHPALKALADQVLPERPNKSDYKFTVQEYRAGLHLQNEKDQEEALDLTNTA